jgi:uncharacterized protein with PIN domain
VIVDTSAVVSVLLRERGHEDLEEKMRGAGQVAIGAPTVVEAKVVMLRRQGVPGAEAVDDLLSTLGVEIVPFGGAHANVAGQALAQFGRDAIPRR